MMNTMSKHHLTLVCTMLMASCVFAQATPTGEAAFFQEASDCTAALKARVVERTTQPKSPARDQAILTDTELGFVYIGVAYKKGLRNPQADEMLKAAEKRWRLLSKPRQQSMLTSCTASAQKLMREVSSFERYIVKNRAKARVDKLLQKERP